jgi:phosphoglycerate dehydrogenase-like enzyme
VVDEGALITALQQGAIAGAGLDVFETEPLDSESSLWQLDNCIITPHCAALSPQYMARAIDLFCRNLEAYIQGETLPTLVDPGRGY